MDPRTVRHNSEFLWLNTLNNQENFLVDERGKLYLASQWQIWMYVKSFVSPSDIEMNERAVLAVHHTLLAIDKLLDSGKLPYLRDYVGWKELINLTYSCFPWYPVDYLAERIKLHPQFKNIDKIIEAANKIIAKKSCYPESEEHQLAISPPIFARDNRHSDLRIKDFDCASHGFYPD